MSPSPAERVLQILRGLRPDADFAASQDFVRDGLLDSFDIVALVNELDAQFRVAVRGADILPENFRSLAAIASLVERSPGKG
jgi:acyl carrier protein